MREGGRQMDKAAVVKWIAGNKVQRQKLDNSKTRNAWIDADTTCLVNRGTFDGSCTGPDGKFRSQAHRAATVWIRAGGTCRAAFHGKIDFHAKNPPLPTKRGQEKETKRTTGCAKREYRRRSEHPQAMRRSKRSVWEAWKAKDVRNSKN